MAALLRAALAGATLLAIYAGTWLSVAPNRLLPGPPRGALEALGAGAHALAALAIGAALLAGLRARWRWAALALAAGGLVLALALAGGAAAQALVGRPPAARAMPGAGLWGALAGFGALALAIAGETGRRGAGPLLGAGLALGLLALWATGALDALSPMVEARLRADRLGLALAEHLRLSAAALALALALAAPLALAAFRSPRLAGPAAAALGLVQVIPGLALFAILIPGLSLLLAALPSLRALGLSALGATPTLVAVALYAALPLFRALLGGLLAADPAAVEAARAMGMTSRRITAEIRLPLGLPLIVGGLRVAAVQSVGLVTLGGLVGAGGLGAIVFEGMAQFAADLILVGAAPIVALAIAADLALRAGERALDPRGAR